MAYDYVGLMEKIKPVSGTCVNPQMWTYLKYEQGTEEADRIASIVNNACEKAGRIYGDLVKNSCISEIEPDKLHPDREKFSIAVQRAVDIDKNPRFDKNGKPLYIIKTTFKHCENNSRSCLSLVSQSEGNMASGYNGMRVEQYDIDSSGRPQSIVKVYDEDITKDSNPKSGYVVNPTIQTVAKQIADGNYDYHERVHTKAPSALTKWRGENLKITPEPVDDMSLEGP